MKSFQQLLSTLPSFDRQYTNKKARVVQHPSKELMCSFLRRVLRFGFHCWRRTSGEERYWPFECRGKVGGDRRSRRALTHSFPAIHHTPAGILMMNTATLLPMRRADENELCTEPASFFFGWCARIIYFAAHQGARGVRAGKAAREKLSFTCCWIYIEGARELQNLIFAFNVELIEMLE